MTSMVDIQKIYKENIKNKHNFSFDLKEKQIKIINYALHKEHSVGVFPTGFGKSLCFMLPPIILDSACKDKRHICLIVSPLKSLMMDQVRQAQKHNISAVYITNKNDMCATSVQGIKDAQYSLVYLSPESLLEIDMWKESILENKKYKNQVCLIAIDEAHLLDTWGVDFRPCFSRLGELQSHFSGVPFLLLTATCTQAILTNIVKKLHLDSPHVESVSSDRPNIYLKYHSWSGMDPMIELKWLLQEIRTKKDQAPKTLLYVRGVSVAGKLYRDFIGYLRSDAFKNGQKSYNNSFVAVYHAGLSTRDQKHVLDTFMTVNSTIRLVICTVAFGLGVNIQDIRQIVHWGACDTVMEYWQEVGRAGRDGSEATTSYYVTPQSLINVSKDMKDLCVRIKNGSATCIRQEIINCFIGKKTIIKKTCKKQCTAECKCNFCMCCKLCRRRCDCQSKS